MAEGLYTDETDVELPPIPATEQPGAHSPCNSPGSAIANRTTSIAQAAPQAPVKIPTTPPTPLSPQVPPAPQVPQAVPVRVCVPPPPRPLAAPSAQPVAPLPPQTPQSRPAGQTPEAIPVRAPVSVTSAAAPCVQPVPSMPGTAPAVAATVLLSQAVPQPGGRIVQPAPASNAAPQAAPAPMTPAQGKISVSVSEMAEGSYTDETDVELPAYTSPILPPQQNDVVARPIDQAAVAPVAVASIPNTPPAAPASAPQARTTPVPGKAMLPAPTSNVPTQTTATTTRAATAAPVAQKPTSPATAKSPGSTPSARAHSPIKSPRKSPIKGSFVEEFSFFSEQFVVPRRSVSEEYVIDTGKKQSSVEKSN